ncbi:CpsD/CapB family tyrosine-protein kinase [uncultured Roseobacter sp.]|uniref:CpsD/CapB family tyrosine-protein kinase n=1 Tax=uncultured Roseobacter sp. TaxID=114847 RepID=UPI002632654A|nr:CpsD/CapB family tyrosine-protein kinase [uncultured Roseobacter sp.]
MEKLQAALEKARHKRSTGTPPDAARPAAQPQAPTPPDDLHAMWQAVTPFEEVPEGLLRARRVVTRQASPSATPFDILRTKLLVQMRQNNWRRLAITSPMPAAGKSTVACNLALGLGRQRDMRSILMDLDLRTPSISDFFETVPPHEIRELLTGEVSLQEQALRFGDNLICSMAAVPESDPTRILLAEDTTDVLQDIEERYQPDLMIFDLPSVLVSDDTRAFLKNVDCALIVARTNSTRYSQLDICEREVAEQTNVLGTVLNAFPYGDKA